MNRQQFEHRYLNKYVNIVLTNNKVIAGRLKKDTECYYHLANDKQFLFKKSHIKNIRFIEEEEYRDCSM